VTVKNFSTAAAKRKPGRKKADIPFTVDGEKGYFVRAEIDDDAMAVVGAQYFAAATTDIAAMGGALMDMLDLLFPEATVKKLLAKVKKRDDPFDLAKLGEVIEWGVEQYSGGRPTTS
jgi:hypothetical protein